MTPINEKDYSNVKKQLLLGSLVVGVGALYLYMTKDDESSIFDGINGFNIDLKPDDLIDSAVNKVISDERLGRSAKEIAKKLSYSILR